MQESPPPIVDPQLWLLQLSDSALPIGTYSHSWGLETAVQSNRLQSASQLIDYLVGHLHQSIAPQEGAACALAHRYSQGSNSLAFIRLQLELTATSWAAEPRKASCDLGQRLNRWAKSTWGLSCPETNVIHHCTAFGWLCGAAELSELTTVRAYLISSIASLVSAAVRLVPLGHSQGQQVLAHMHGDIASAVSQCLTVAGPEYLHSFSPLRERDCQAHRTLYSRLFQS